MNPETLTHIFEPFFTTKEFGKGTGLGLATVYGIVKQNGGFINVYSEPGQGTVFRIFLPRTEDEGDAAETMETIPALSGSEVVLLVEDNDLVRSMASKMLDSLGYTVYAAENPLKALAFCETSHSPIDLLITDVIMPDMSGVELHNKIATLQPTIKVLFISGYTANVIAHRGVLDEGVHYLPKPFNRNELAQKVKEALSGTESKR